MQSSLLGSFPAELLHKPVPFLHTCVCVCLFMHVYLYVCPFFCLSGTFLLCSVGGYKLLLGLLEKMN